MAQIKERDYCLMKKTKVTHKGKESGMSELG